MSKGKDLDVRMKEYEACYQVMLPNRSYVIIRLDGKGFSKYTKLFNKPFDDILSKVMDKVAVDLCSEFNPKFAYTQSDEISLILTEVDNINAELPYNGKLQKLCSLTAAKATAAFNKFMLSELATKYGMEELYNKIITNKLPEISAVFDSRVFIIPDFREVANYFIWRQQDCTRNSISMAATAYFSHKTLNGKSSSEKQEMLFKEKGINWNDYAVKYKRGVVINRWVITLENNGENVVRNRWLPDYQTPIFTENKDYLYKLIPKIS